MKNKEKARESGKRKAKGYRTLAGWALQMNEEAPVNKTGAKCGRVKRGTGVLIRSR